MKFRTGFVTNSSSSIFIASLMENPQYPSSNELYDDMVKFFEERKYTIFKNELVEKVWMKYDSNLKRYIPCLPSDKGAEQHTQSGIAVFQSKKYGMEGSSQIIENLCCASRHSLIMGQSEICERWTNDDEWFTKIYSPKRYKDTVAHITPRKWKREKKIWMKFKQDREDIYMGLFIKMYKRIPSSPKEMYIFKKNWHYNKGIPKDSMLDVEKFFNEEREKLLPLNKGEKISWDEIWKKIEFLSTDDDTWNWWSPSSLYCQECIRLGRCLNDCILGRWGVSCKEQMISGDVVVASSENMIDGEDMMDLVEKFNISLFNEHNG